MNARKLPYYILLLPLFYVLHAYQTHALPWSTAEYLSIAWRYLLPAVLLLLIAFALARQWQKAGLLAFILLAADFFLPLAQLHLSYKIFLPLVALLVVALLVLAWRSKQPPVKLTRYLNLLFLVLLIADAALISYREVSGKEKVVPVGKDYVFPNVSTAPTPDIYFILLDEYAGPASLQKDFGFDNSALDSFLTGHGFFVAHDARSNYNFTSFSLASALNMRYIQTPGDGKVNASHYHQAEQLIRDNEVVRALGKRGYDFINQSIFDIAGQPVNPKPSFAPSAKEIIYRSTLIGKADYEIGWNFRNTGALRKSQHEAEESIFTGIGDRVHKIKSLSAVRSAKPRFIYTHLLVPHPPFFMNHLQRRSSAETDSLGKRSIEGYRGNVAYANELIRDMVQTILRNTNGNAVIILTGDHGFRWREYENLPHHFSILHAIYWPGKDYSDWQQNSSLVNLFRKVLSRIYGVRLNDLEEKEYFLRDKE
ncbi:sulfatase-like hydrolase/transferase [Nostoc ellipsosporum NOK]|nr:sulfatase-like hydrolase/transferase [Nostoc ellipsosporum NOK]